MTHRTAILWTLAFCLGLAIAGATHAQSAAPPRAPISAQLTLDELLADGWELVAPDVLELRHEDGRVETLALGRAGFEAELAIAETQLELLETRFAQTGNLDLLDSIDDVEAVLETLRSELDGWGGKTGTRVGSMDGLTSDEPIAVGCTTTITRTAVAGPGTDGPEAEGWASFNDTCLAYGDVYVYTYAEGALGTQFTTHSQTDNPPAAYGSSSAHAFSSVVADNDCYSYAYARVRIQDDLGNWSTWIDSDSNTLCRQLTVDIIGPTSISVPCGVCKLVQWSASTNLPVTTYTWRWDGSVIGGNSSSVTRGFCSPNPTYGFSEYHTISVDVTDGVQSAFDSQGVRISYSGCFSTCDSKKEICPIEETPTAE